MTGREGLKIELERESKLEKMLTSFRLKPLQRLSFI
ncbi:hypothetical protein SAMN05421868_14036 [Paenibacillus naphthalenovorans]|nr:hypothetical protein SAMN05421868_14036 [Paenibacillus naphthalenovorans]